MKTSKSGVSATRGWRPLAVQSSISERSPGETSSWIKTAWVAGIELILVAFLEGVNALFQTGAKAWVGAVQSDAPPSSRLLLLPGSFRTTLLSTVRSLETLLGFLLTKVEEQHTNSRNRIPWHETWNPERNNTPPSGQVDEIKSWISDRFLGRLLGLPAVAKTLRKTIPTIAPEVTGGAGQIVPSKVLLPSCRPKGPVENKRKESQPSQAGNSGIVCILKMLIKYIYKVYVIMDISKKNQKMRRHVVPKHADFLMGGWGGGNRH